MSHAINRMDITNSPDLARLAEEVRASMQPRYLEKDGEALVMVTPVASKRTGTGAEATAGTAAADEEVRTMERDEARRRLFVPVSDEEIARRQALVAEILKNRERRVIAPVTSADLVHQVREEEYRSYDDRQ